MSDCHSWPLDVSNNLSGYFISNLVLVTSCVSMGGFICLWLSLTTLNSEEFTLCSGSFNWGGSICFWYLYVYICTGISLYFLISWLFRMGSHWTHWTVKSSLCALAVSNRGWRGVYCKFYPGKTEISLYFLISWLFRMGSHWWYWKVKSSLCALAVSNGGVYCQFYLHKYDNLSSFQVLLLLHRALLFLIRNERPTNKG